MRIVAHTILLTKETFMSNTVKLGEFCWNELMTSDVKQAKEFYSTLLGWKCQDFDMGDKTYTMIKMGDKDIGGMMETPRDKKNIPPHWLSYISVEDIDKIVKKAESLGGKITVPATNVSDFGRFAIIQDPTGAQIAFWQSLKSC